ncbi:hypothetical protein EOA32_01090 [Mesorhizobium sp. M1A.F.Ca.ET.072.01.1.1]|uniref:hypothetical protein n=1 Tax=Mesorhizobium sp. M1A.F.Ca.ET.072.01.1.1 TaxID=2496753 RepID=UPI000FD48410|nr:hypothetical protein [Mesorhizobium sp. M1A.F.Ca.ET.072.01.1.1]RUW55645.1 hypothetical protein EOA32_01090 [Mesorhizobium sp. M1A.F.Ca.ET.072.01.1.1]
MFSFLRRKPSQISSQPILETGIDRMIGERDAHLAAMNRLERVINDAQTAYNQHARLYEALNNSLFAINHPFNDKAIQADLADAFADIEFDADLSVDQPSDEERAAAAYASLPDSLKATLPLAPTPQELADAEPLNTPVIPLSRSARRRANTERFKKAAE